MFCMNCGQELPEMAKFCFSCGSKTEQISANANVSTLKIAKNLIDEYVLSKQGTPEYKVLDTSRVELIKMMRTWMKELNIIEVSREDRREFLHNFDEQVMKLFNGNRDNKTDLGITLDEFRQKAPSMTGFREGLLAYRKSLSNSWDYNAYVGILLGVGGAKHGDVACMNFAIGQGDNGNNTKKTLEANGLMPIFEKYKGKKIDTSIILSEVEDEIVRIAPQYVSIRQYLHPYLYECNDVSSVVSPATEKKINNSSGIQYLISQIMPNIVNGAFWSFIDKQIVMNYMEDIRNSNGQIVVRQLQNIALLEISPYCLINTFNETSSEPITAKDVENITQVIADTQITFERFLINRGKSSEETGQLFANKIAIYNTKDTMITIHNGINYPAFAIDMRIALSLLYMYGYKIKVAGRYVTASEVAEAGNDLWSSVTLTPDKSAVFIDIACTYDSSRIKQLEKEFKIRNNVRE